MTKQVMGRFRYAVSDVVGSKIVVGDVEVSSFIQRSQDRRPLTVDCCLLTLKP